MIGLNPPDVHNASDLDHPLHDCRIERVFYQVNANPEGVPGSYESMADAEAAALDWSRRSQADEIMEECRQITITIDTVMLCRGQRGLLPPVVIGTRTVEFYPAGDRPDGKVVDTSGEHRLDRLYKLRRPLASWPTATPL